MAAVSVQRVRSGVQAVANIELFFDLVYAFAVTHKIDEAMLEARLVGVR